MNELDAVTSSAEQGRTQPSRAEYDVTRFATLARLAAKEKKGGSNKKEEQWRRWLANYKVRIRSPANRVPSSAARQTSSPRTVGARRRPVLRI